MERFQFFSRFLNLSRMNLASASWVLFGLAIYLPWPEVSWPWPRLHHWIFNIERIDILVYRRRFSVILTIFPVGFWLLYQYNACSLFLFKFKISHMIYFVKLHITTTYTYICNYFISRNIWRFRSFADVSIPFKFVNLILMICLILFI